MGYIFYLFFECLFFEQKVPGQKPRLIALLAEVASENYSIILLLSCFSTALCLDTTYIALNIARNLHYSVVVMLTTMK